MSFTVKELIEKLKTLEQDKKVFVNECDILCEIDEVMDTSEGVEILRGPMG